MNLQHQSDNRGLVEREYLLLRGSSVCSGAAGLTCAEGWEGIIGVGKVFELLREDCEGCWCS